MILLQPRKNGYDILNIKNNGGKAWESEQLGTTKHGETNWFNTLTGYSRKNDFFILNKNAIEIRKRQYKSQKSRTNINNTEN